MITKIKQQSTESELFREGYKGEVKVTVSYEEYEDLNNENQAYKNLIKKIATLHSDPYQRVDNMEDAIKLIIKQTTNEGTIGKEGEIVYTKLRESLELSHLGKFVVIDIGKQEIIAIEDTPTKAIIEAKKIADKHYFMRRIGKNIYVN